ncbi:MAG: hypothetical protein JRI23_36065 [Deltaproteobacteria bacterium]|jgi:uncharacterized Zn finger protein (UPF0148 family)|nr:hypothetical protein [Deltaproteobacteria bacterium]MBW2537766.1 hypothetical protein [Deltaproteobacteria bacterium]
MATQYDLELRVIACAECGAPLDVGPAGGTSTCRYCGREQSTKAAVREVPRAASAPAEPERIATLRAQDVHSIDPPRELSELFVGIDLLPWKINDALALWNSLRRSLAREADEFQSERLHRLTQALAAHFGAAQEPLRQRALLETALDVLRTPRHQQAACAALCRAACRANDLRAAEGWLALCDPRPLELESDTELRFAQAYLALLQGNPQRMLEVLGQSWSDVPIANVHEAECVALRSHAWEQLGRPDHATELLDHFMQHTSSYGRFLCRRFVALHQHLGLCAQSGPAADAAQRQRGLRLVEQKTGAPGLAWGITLGTVALGLLVAAVLVLTGPGWGWGYYAAGMGGFMASAFVVVARNSSRKARRARQLCSRGVSAAARIVHASPTNQATMGVPQLMYRVLVLPASGAPFEAHSIFHADAALRARFAPGALAVARFDPSDHRQVHLELD